VFPPHFLKNAGAAQVASLLRPSPDAPSSSLPPSFPPSDAAASFLAAALATLLSGDALRCAEEAVRAALGHDAPARLRALALAAPAAAQGA
jgi:hypothetical protein